MTIVMLCGIIIIDDLTISIMMQYCGLLLGDNMYYIVKYSDIVCWNSIITLLYWYYSVWEIEVAIDCDDLVVFLTVVVSQCGTLLIHWHWLQWYGLVIIPIGVPLTYW